MYPLGLLPFLTALVPDPFAVSAALVIPVLILAFWVYAVVPTSRGARLGDACGADEAAPVHLPGFSLGHILPFFHQRFDFINQGFQLAGQAIYQFSLLRVRTSASPWPRTHARAHSRTSALVRVRTRVGWSGCAGPRGARCRLWISSADRTLFGYRPPSSCFPAKPLAATFSKQETSTSTRASSFSLAL